METRLSHFTTFRLGGSCRELVSVVDAASAADILRTWNAAGLPWRVMGGGSNLLVADAGLPERVLRFAAETPECRLATDGTLEVSAATPLDALPEFAAANGRGGVGFASGIPGTVGGGVCGNAGAFGRQLGDVLDRVEILTRAGELRRLPRSALEFAYRASSLPQMGVVVRAWFRTAADDRAKLRAEREGILALRREKHPDWRTDPTAGSFFKNLPPAQPGELRRAAGKYLELAGAKDLRVGGAYVFAKHANIVVAGPGATARDVATLAGRMAAAVREKFGFELEPEVRFWGAV